MKHHLIITSALMALFMMASCSEEDMPQGQVSGDFVTFKVAVPQISTRAISDGYTANRLYWGVYDHEGLLLPEISNTDKDLKEDMVFSGSGEVKLTLAQDKDYSIVFWAANESNSMCDVDWDGRCLSVEPKEANQESYDAFCAYVEINNVSGYKTQEVKLYRPFAQLNIGTADYAKAAASGLTVENTRIKVSGLPVKYNFVDGSTEGDRTMVYDYPKSPVSFKGETFPVDGYEYLAMNYILVEKDKELVTVKLSYLDDDDQEHERTYTSVPVQRNWRTNIYGNILTSETDFTVTIVPGFNETDHNIEVWDGKTTEEPKITENTENPGEVVAEITNGAQLAWIAQMLNGTVNNARTTRSGEEVDYSKMTIKLGANIDLGNEQWTSIGTSEKPFSGKLEGNGYTISNLKIVETEAKEGKAYVGFFGYAKDVAIKDVTFDNVYINIACLDIDHSQGHIGAVVGSLEGASTIENVTVKGDIKVEATFDANGASRVAVVAGGNTYGDVTMKNVKVEAKEGSYLKVNNNTGALAGQLQGKAVFENCSSNINVTVKKFFAGGIIGLTAGDSKFTNCHTTGDVAVVAGRDGRHNDEYRVGGIAGGWADGKDKVCTLENCSYTGNVSGKNADGSVAEPLDYAGYVGRGYTLANCAGSKVVIDGVEYVQAYDNVYGVYVCVVNGSYVVSSDTDLQNAIACAKDGETITLLNDIVAVEENATNGNAAYYTGDKSFTIDLNGKKFTANTSNAGFRFQKSEGGAENTIIIKNGTVIAGESAWSAISVGSNSENVTNVKLSGLTVTSCKANDLAIRARSGSKFNIENCNVTATNGAGAIVAGGGDVTLTNVTVSQTGVYNWNSVALGVHSGAKMVVNSGTYSSNPEGNTKGNWVAYIMSSGGTLEINGGKFNGTVAEVADANNACGLICADTKAVVNINGGEFTSNGAILDMRNNTGQLPNPKATLKGGVFSADPRVSGLYASNLISVAEGYDVNENENGTWTVFKMPEAQINGTTYPTLADAISAASNGSVITMLDNIKLYETVVLEDKNITLDLNEKTITAVAVDAFTVNTGAKLILKNGTVSSHGAIVRAVGGEVVVESGTYTQTGTAVESDPVTYRYCIDSREKGKITINGGEFYSNNGMINVGSEVIINGGKFENIVEKTMTRHFAYVSDKLTINGGEFLGKANGSAGGCFFCGAAAGCDIQVTGGKFTSLWTSGSANRIFEVYYGGSINVTGGMFNTNGGIKSFVTENTDDATKAAYPYVAK